MAVAAHNVNESDDFAAVSMEEVVPPSVMMT